MIINKQKIHVFSFEPIDSRMYVWAEDGQAMIIDPCISEAAWEILEKEKVRNAQIILTHEHYDHISGVNWLRDKIDCQVICSENCARRLCDPQKNLSAYFNILFMNHTEEIKRQISELQAKCYSCHADVTFSVKKEISIGSIHLDLRETPGHSSGSICAYLSEQQILFSGDTLVNGTPTVTRLPGGSKKDFQRYTVPWLKKLPSNVIVFPGHGEIAILDDLMTNIE